MLNSRGVDTGRPSQAADVPRYWTLVATGAETRTLRDALVDRSLPETTAVVIFDYVRYWYDGLFFRTRVMQLQEYFQRLGLPEDAWHVGPEHPGVERLALTLLADQRRSRILELGVQSGGFAVPVILETATRPAFSYTGVDNLEYNNAVPLRLIESYLRDHGVTAPLKFIEGDSTPVVRSAGRHAYDFIFVDHYKPKYPLDLYLICSRDVLSEHGTILVHDVLTHAASDWKVCKQVCRAFGYRWEIDSDVSQGAAIIVRNPAAQGTRVSRAAVALRVYTRWAAHSIVLTARRRVGRSLRSMGLRR